VLYNGSNQLEVFVGDKTIANIYL